MRIESCTFEAQNEDNAIRVNNFSSNSTWLSWSKAYSFIYLFAGWLVCLIWLKLVGLICQHAWQRIDIMQCPPISWTLWASVPRPKPPCHWAIIIYMKIERWIFVQIPDKESREKYIHTHIYIYINKSNDSYNIAVLLSRYKLPFRELTPAWTWPVTWSCCSLTPSAVSVSGGGGGIPEAHLCLSLVKNNNRKRLRGPVRLDESTVDWGRTKAGLLALRRRNSCWRPTPTVDALSAIGPNLELLAITLNSVKQKKSYIFFIKVNLGGKKKHWQTTQQPR